VVLIFPFLQIAKSSLNFPIPCDKRRPWQASYIDTSNAISLEVKPNNPSDGWDFYWPGPNVGASIATGWRIPAQAARKTSVIAFISPLQSENQFNMVFIIY